MMGRKIQIQEWYGYELVKCPFCDTAVGVMALHPDDAVTESYCGKCKAKFKVVRHDMTIKSIKEKL